MQQKLKEVFSPLHKSYFCRLDLVNAKQHMLKTPVQVLMDLFLKNLFI